MKISRFILFALIFIAVSCGEDNKSDKNNQNPDNETIQDSDNLLIDEDSPKIDVEPDANDESPDEITDETGDETGDSDLNDTEAPDIDSDSSKYPYPFESVKPEWKPCEDNAKFECAATTMPLFWRNGEDKRTISVYAKRLLSKSNSKAQLWLLHGGPGASGTHDFPPMMEIYQQLYPELDVYTIDHRGVGFSERLGCPEEESEESEAGTYISENEYDPCIKYLKDNYGDRLNGFTTTDSAIDVAAYIEATRENDKKVFVWGGSYGTYIGHRYVQIFPNQADGTIMEGIVDPTGGNITRDEEVNVAGQMFFDECKNDYFCAKKFNGDPWGALGNLLKKVDENHCQLLVENGISKNVVKYLMVMLMYYYPNHQIVPSLVYRLSRCNQGDMEAMAYLYNNTFGGNGDMFQFDISYSSVLANNIAFSEMFWIPEYDDWDLPAYFEKVEAETYISFGYNMSMIELYEKWPKYNDTEYDNKWGETDKPMLMIQGRLDPATTYLQAKKWEEHFNKENQHFLTFPYSPHNVTFSTATENIYDCAASEMVEFIKNPERTGVGSCVKDTVPPNFKGNESIAKQFYNTNDLWENTGVAKKSVKQMKLPPMYNAQMNLIKHKLRSEFPNLPDKLVIKKSKK